MFAWSRPPSGRVSDDDPILTTILRAAATSGRIAPSVLPDVTDSPEPPWSPTVEARVGSARSDPVLRPGQHPRLPVKRDVADDDLGTLFGAGLRQFCLDAEPVQPVGQVPDGFVVGEVGLLDPALRAIAFHHETRADFGHCEAAVVDGARAQHDARRLIVRSRCPGLLDELGHGKRELAQTFAGLSLIHISEPTRQA